MPDHIIVILFKVMGYAAVLRMATQGTIRQTGSVYILNNSNYRNKFYFFNCIHDIGLFHMYHVHLL